MIVRNARAACAFLLCVTAMAARADAQAEGAAAAPAYEDALIDGGNLPPDLSTDMSAGQNRAGWPRAFQVQATTSSLSRDDVDSDESGIRLGGMLDTPNFGAFTLEANLRTSNDFAYGSGNRFTLVQRGLPMNGGWLGDNALGVFNTPSADLARYQYRFYIPTIPAMGAATEWRQSDRLQLYASVGEPGIFTGIYVPTFDGLGGQLANGGLQWNLADQWSVAVQMVDVNGVNFGIGQSDAPGTISSQAWFGAVAWGGPDARVQLNLVNGAVDGNASQSGGWVDATIHYGRTGHNFGAYYVEPDIVWGNQPLSSDLQGGYYRLDFQGRRWLLNGGVDYVAPVEGDEDSTVFTTGYARYQYSADVGLGSGANIRQGPTDAWSVFTFLDQVNRWGIGRAQANYAQDEVQDYIQLTLDETWDTQPGFRLGTAVNIGRANLETYNATTAGLAVNSGGDVWRNLSINVNARWDKSFDDTDTDNKLANIALNWGFAQGWTVGANYYQNRNTGRLPLTVTSPLPDTPLFIDEQSRERGVLLSLRYEWQAGSRSAPLGGRPGSGAGSVSGVLYLDANDTARLEAGESGAANVVILLDGRFSARTNSEGRFEFPSVAAGAHVLTVVPDNLPLPWVIPDDGRVSIQVGVRDETRVELPVRRLR